MPITQEQKDAAEQHQWIAAKAIGYQVRIVAGPGTGKTGTIEKRVAHLLNSGVQADSLFVISFTRATCAELKQRIVQFCAKLPCAASSTDVRVSTMHSLALRILRRANLLMSYPSDPILLDNWEQKQIYDHELAEYIGCTPSRSKEIRLAHDAQWQTLKPQSINQEQITQAEIQKFNTFHATRTNLYSCVLPGEVIFKCVEALRQGTLIPQGLPHIDHLIVDEYQDLNDCDQEFIRLLSQGNTVLFIAGDDDQSIYSFRHANPNGIVNFETTYPRSVIYSLTDCFRCTPLILNAALNLIHYNPSRIDKSPVSLYANATPPVQGKVHIWQFPSPKQEAHAIAASCRTLIQAGMAGREDQILILISNRRLQLKLIEREISAFNLIFDSPNGLGLVDDFDVFRAVYSMLRILKDMTSDEEDYIAYRNLLGLLSGVGQKTAMNIGDKCIANNQNFRTLFHLAMPPQWLGNREIAAVQRIIACVQGLAGWVITDTLLSRANDIGNLLFSQVLNSGDQVNTNKKVWNKLIDALPEQMILDELLSFFDADTYADQEGILNTVNQRISGEQQQTNQPTTKKIRILTMHGAKGLTGSIVFIPSAEQGIMPNQKALQATGLLIEQRRLFYVSLTRAKACCIISHTHKRTGFQARAVFNSGISYPTRSQFLNEMDISTARRTEGLTAAEAQSIVSEVNNL